MAPESRQRSDHCAPALLLADGPTDTVTFHAQQGVEKALKALLTFHRVEFPRIHDLVRLFDLVSPYLSGLEEYRAAFAEMSNYSVQVRYPDEFLGPNRDEVVRSLAVASEVVAKIRKKISEVS